MGLRLSLRSSLPVIDRPPRGPGDGTDFVRFWPDDVPQGPYLPYPDALRAVEAVTATFRALLSGDGTPDPAPPRVAHGTP